MTKINGSKTVKGVYKKHNYLVLKQEQKTQFIEFIPNSLQQTTV